MAGINVVVVTVETGSAQVLPAADALALVIGDPQTYRLEPPFGTGAFTSEGLLRAFQLGTSDPTATYSDLIDALRLVTANDVPLTPIAHLAALNAQAAFAEIVAGDVDRDADIVTALANAAAASVTANAAGVTAAAGLALASAAIASSALETDVTLASNSNARVPATAAVRAYVGAALTAIGSLNPLGVIDASANPNYPAANKGDLYFISVTGLVGGGTGAAVGAGDYIVCFVNGSAAGNQATVGANWGVVHFATAIAILSVANIFSAAQTITVGAAGTAFTVKSTNASSSPGPDLVIFRDSASPAAADAIGQLPFWGRRSDGNTAIYAAAAARILVETATVESGAFDILTSVAGAYARRFSVGAGLTSQGVTGGDKGVGTANIGTLYESNVRVMTPATAMTPTDAAIAATMQDLWGMDRLDLNTQGANADTDITTAWNAAMAKAATRTKSCLMIGHGVFNQPNNTPLLWPYTADNFVICGHGAQATSINFTTRVNGNLIEIGADHALDPVTLAHVNELTEVRLEHLAVNAPAAHASGAMLAVENTRFFYPRHLRLTGGWKVMSFGAAATIGNSCRDIYAHALRMQNSSASNSGGVANPTPFIHLASGTTFELTGESRAGGAGSTAVNFSKYCFLMDGTGFNWDSVLIEGLFGENIAQWARSVGKGMGGFSWLGNNVDSGDGTIPMFYAAPTTGNQVKDWIIANAKIGGTASDVVSLSDVNGGSVLGCVLSHCIPTDVDGHVHISTPAGIEGVVIEGNVFRNCGQIGTSLISAGFRSGSIMNNHTILQAGKSPFTVMVNWVAPSASADRFGPTATTNAYTRAFNSAKGGTGANSGLFTGTP